MNGLKTWKLAVIAGAGLALGGVQSADALTWNGINWVEDGVQAGDT
jgi:hypothetical protein